MYYKSAQTSENINNFTICVKDGDFIRKMSCAEDCTKNTVYVSNILMPKIEDGNIAAGEYGRCIEVMLIPKIDL